MTKTYEVETLVHLNLRVRVHADSEEGAMAWVYAAGLSPEGRAALLSGATEADIALVDVTGPATEVPG